MVRRNANVGRQRPEFGDIGPVHHRSALSEQLPGPAGAAVRQYDPTTRTQNMGRA
jgi:hypothetical protein